MATFQVIQLNPKKFQASQIKFLLILLPICAVMLLPIIYIFCQAFKPLDELFYFPPKILVYNPTMSNFEELIRLARTTGLPWMRYLLNFPLCRMRSWNPSAHLSAAMSRTACAAPRRWHRGAARSSPTFPLCPTAFS